MRVTADSPSTPHPFPGARAAKHFHKPDPLPARLIIWCTAVVEVWLLMKQNRTDKNSPGMSRRRFLGLAAASLVTSCRSARQPVAAPTSPPPAATPTAIPAPAATPTSPPAAAAAPAGPPDVLKFYPDVPSRVVQTHHTGVWNGDQLSPQAIRQMLDASITRLTGLNDAREAWSALFRPTEKVAIKINAFQNSTIWTHAPLVRAVVDSLQDAGLAADQIFIYDHLSMLKEAGYEVNKDGPGVRCFEETDFTGEWAVADRNVRLSSTLQSCDALINMPVLKSHMISGLTFAMKNHFGTVESPGSLHTPIDQCIAGLNALPAIKDRSRLIIGDVLEANLRYTSSWPYWKPDWKGDSILMSFDPVAHDTVGMQILEQLQTENEAVLSPALREKATSYLKIAAELGLGSDDLKNIEVMEASIG